MAGQSGNKNKKYGRNKAKCLRYTNNNTRVKNKLRKMMRHLKQFPKDLQTLSAHSKLQAA